MSNSVYQKKPRTLIKDVSCLKEPKRLAINKHKEDRYCALAQSSNPQHPPSPQISKARTCFSQISILSYVVSIARLLLKKS